MAAVRKKKGGPVRRRKIGTGRDEGYDPFWKIRPNYRVLTVANLSEALIAYRGNLSAIARSFKVTRAAVAKFITENPDTLRPLLAEAREITVDRSEWNLFDAADAGEPWAVRYVLD